MIKPQKQQQNREKGCKQENQKIGCWEGRGDHSVEVKTLPPSSFPHQLVHFNWFRSFQESRKNRIANPPSPPSSTTKGLHPAYIAPRSPLEKKRNKEEKKTKGFLEAAAAAY
ncbi:hypothetical protein JTE90_020943 [Oedothorax gibbosus]|uniref:Uncharacterized protein n=1 Tax=Oedothorax gibbosus TaxID=931172 RepID=A0AAV6VN58_9ARAC|nr:hypothetical protein JTE90_020943 [Oedothorax gibbosus]